MASVWIARRGTADGGVRHRVMFRLGGRESSPRYGGSFRTLREARMRRDWITGKLAALRVPDLRALERQAPATTLTQAAERWRASRVDVSPGTMQTYRVAIKSASDLAPHDAA